MNIREEVLKRKAEMIKDLSDWIKTKGVLDPSTAGKNKPFGDDVKASLDFIYNKAKADGFKAENVDGYCIEVTYGEGEENVSVLSHCDVVPEGSDWIHQPYGGEIEDNLIYGRGALDDKGPGIAAYYGLKIIKDLNIPLKRKIRFVFGGNEENGSKCLEHYFKELKKEPPTYGFTPDADFPLIYGEKGILGYEYNGEFKDNVILELKSGTVANAVPGTAKFVLDGIYNLDKAIKKVTKKTNTKVNVEYKDNKTYVEVIGVAAHAAEPMLGENALVFGLNIIAKGTKSKLARYYGPLFRSYFGKYLGIACVCKTMTPLTCNIGLGSYDGSKYSFTLNIRYPINVTGTQIAAILKKKALHKGQLTGDTEPLYVDPESDFIKCLMKVYKEVTGEKNAKPITIGGGTYAKETTNTVAFGMEFKRNNGSGRIHSPEEALNIDDLVDGCEIYTKALIELGNL